MCAEEGWLWELLVPLSFEFLLQFVLLCSHTSLTQEETLAPEGSCKGARLLSVSYSPGDALSNDKHDKHAESECWSGAGGVNPYEPPFQALEPQVWLDIEEVPALRLH